MAWHALPLTALALPARAVAQGIVFSVRPPHKSWKNIANLSGGEKTLSSLSLVFALHHYKPTPLYVMDEIDAALGALHASSCSPTSLYMLSRRNNACTVRVTQYMIGKPHDLQPCIGTHDDARVLRGLGDQGVQAENKCLLHAGTYD